MNRWIMATAAVLALGAAAPATAAPPPPPGGISGKGPAILVGRIPADTGKWSQRLPGSVLALRLLPGPAQYTVSPGRSQRYRLRVDPGVYGLATTRWKGKRAVTTATIVRARGGKRTKLQAAGGGPFVSIGRVTGPGGTDLSSALRTPMVDAADSSRCDFSIGIDRDDPAYEAILKELRLQTTSNFPEKTQRAAAKALKEQAAYTPQYRVEGTVTQAAGEYSGAASGTFRLVQAKTGAVLFEKQVSFADAGTRALFDAAAKDLSNAVCGVPTAFTGTVQATIRFDATGQTWQWSGTAGFVLESGGEKPDGSFAIEYALEQVTVDSATYTGPTSANCSEVRATWAGAPPVKGGNLILTVSADGTRSYRLALGVNTGIATASATCDKETVTFPVVMGLGLISDPVEAWLGPTLAETFSGPWLPGGIVVADPFQMQASWVLQPVGLD